MLSSEGAAFKAEWEDRVRTVRYKTKLTQIKIKIFFINFVLPLLLDMC